MDVWHEVGVQLKLKREKRRKYGIFSLFFWQNRQWVSRERDERNFSFSLRSMEIRWSESVEPRFKVHLLDEGYAWVPTTCSFTEDFGFGEENLVRKALPSL